MHGRLVRRHQRRDLLAAQVRHEARAEIVQHVAPLLATGGHHRQHPLHEPAPLGTVRPATDPAPDHGVSQRALRSVVRRLDPLHAHEGPQTLLHLEDLEARRRRLDATATLARFQRDLDLAPQPRRNRLEPPPIDRPIANAVPPAEHPLGQPLGVGPQATPFEVVGVVRDSIYESLREAPPPTVYLPLLQRIGRSGAVFEVRVNGSLAQVASALRAGLKPMLPGMPIEVHTFTAQVEQMLVEERLMATLAASFGFLGLVLAVIGLYGLLAYTVARRTSEIGIRMALGANRRRVVAMVMKQAAALMLAGLVIGAPCALALTKLAQ